jgi:hypothetical protein
MPRLGVVVATGRRDCSHGGARRRPPQLATGKTRGLCLLEPTASSLARRSPALSPGGWGGGCQRPTAATSRALPTPPRVLLLRISWRNEKMKKVGESRREWWTQPLGPSILYSPVCFGPKMNSGITLMFDHWLRVLNKSVFKTTSTALCKIAIRIY